MSSQTTIYQGKYFFNLRVYLIAFTTDLVALWYTPRVFFERPVAIDRRLPNYSDVPHVMTTSPISVLAIEDTPYYVRTIHAMLKADPRFQFELVHAAVLAEGLELLTHDSPNVVLLDLLLPDSAGLDTFNAVYAITPRLPIVILSNTDDESLALEAVRRGAQDYLVKGQFDSRLLTRSIRYAIERKRSEQALHESQERSRSLEQELLNICEREQQRIGRDLHDSVGQELTGLSYLAGSLTKKLNERRLPEAELAEQIVGITGTALREVRNAIHGLAPVDLEPGGLTVALQQLATSISERFQIVCQVEHDRSTDNLDFDTATHLYRIAQEAMNNAVKHAQPSRVTIRLGTLENRVRMQIEDDGRGIQSDRDSASGFGLDVMQYRADAIGATLEIDSQPGGGTRVTCFIDTHSDR